MRAAATVARSSREYLERSVPFGKYWRRRPLVFSFVPHCHGLRGPPHRSLWPHNHAVHGAGASSNRYAHLSSGVKRDAVQLLDAPLLAWGNTGATAVG